MYIHMPRTASRSDYLDTAPRTVSSAQLSSSTSQNLSQLGQHTEGWRIMTKQAIVRMHRSTQHAILSPRRAVLSMKIQDTPGAHEDAVFLVL